MFGNIPSFALVFVFSPIPCGVIHGSLYLGLDHGFGSSNCGTASPVMGLNRFGVFFEGKEGNYDSCDYNSVFLVTGARAFYPVSL